MKAWNIGRSRQAHIIISDGSVSRQHAELVETEDGRYYLTDCDSKFGTYMRQGRGKWKRVRQVYIEKGDGVRLGEYETSLPKLLEMISDDSVPRPPEYVFVVEKETKPDISELPAGEPVERDPVTGKIIPKDSNQRSG